LRLQGKKIDQNKAKPCRRKILRLEGEEKRIEDGELKTGNGKRRTENGKQA